MQSLYREKRWAELQAYKENGILEEFLFSCDIGKICYRFFKREAGTVKSDVYFDIASYRGAEGPYIEECIKGEEKELLTRFDLKFAKYCDENNIIAEFAKLDPWDDYAELIRRHYGAEYYGNYYCNTLDSNFYKEEYNRRSRRSIRKAKDMGVTVSVDYDGDTISEFVRLYKNTEEKYHTSDYYNFSAQDIRKYFDLLKGSIFLVNAVYNNEIITSVLTAMGKDIVHYLFLGNNPEYLALQGNSLLTYETALIGARSGRKIFDMGGR